MGIEKYDDVFVAIQGQSKRYWLKMVKLPSKHELILWAYRAMLRLQVFMQRLRIAMT